MIRWFLAGIAAIAGASAAAAAMPPARATIPFRAVGSTVLVPVSVNGSETGWFILDSGANSCSLDKAFARRLSLRPDEGGQATGAGRGTVPYDRYKEEVRFNVGGLPFECPQRRVVGLDFSNQPAVIGTSINGVLGTDFFSTYIVEIDYSRHVVRAYDPRAFTYAGSGIQVPMAIDERRLPHIDAVLTVNGEDRATRPLLVDSGSQDAVDDDWVLRSRSLRTALGGVGIGQPYEVKMGRFSEIRIGPFAFADVPAFGGGVPLIGGEILRHFTVIFDWPRKQLILEPNPGLSRSLSEAGAAGLAMRANPDGTARVEFVSAGSPAQIAHLAAGDVITAIDGTPSAKFEFDQLTQLFRPGRSYRLDVLRAGKPLTLQLDL